MIANIYYVDEEHYDIKGNAYMEFMEKCFNHSSYFSFVSSYCSDECVLMKYAHIYEALKPYLIFEKEQVDHWPGTWLDKSDPHTREIPNFYLYRCCDETKRILKEEVDSLFSWESGRPEDLTFYYADKKIFLLTISHEGDCIISCTPEVFQEFKPFNYWSIDSETEFLEETYF